MSAAQRISGRGRATPHSFIVAGVSMMAIRKELKPALPKKKQEASFLVVISAAATSVRVAIAGAAIDLPAITSGSFIVELPFLQINEADRLLRPLGISRADLERLLTGKTGPV